LGSADMVLQVFRFLFELSDTHDVPFDLMLHDTDSGVSDLVGEKDFLEIGKVRVSLEQVQQVQR
jgi:hypothetical protein